MSSDIQSSSSLSDFCHRLDILVLPVISIFSSLYIDYALVDFVVTLVILPTLKIQIYYYF